MTAHEDQVMEQALNNPLILQKILNLSQFPQLKESRRVNKTWQEISSKIIIQRHSRFINFRYSPKSPDFYMVTSTPTTPKSLTSLNQILSQSSVPFPVSDFKFMNGNLTLEIFRNFLVLHGQQIRSLRFRYCDDTEVIDLTTFLNIFNLAPKIENLYLTNFNCPKISQLEDDNFVLPCLKKFKWIRSSSVALKILKGSPNLTEIPFINFSKDLDTLEKSGRVSLLKECPYYCDPTKRAFLTQFSSLGVNLETLKINNSSMGNAGGQLDRILESSKDSLKHLIMSHHLTRSRVTLPSLKNLKGLTLTMEREERLFPKGINFNWIFPSLEILDCQGLSLGQDQLLPKLFPPPDAYFGNFSKVKVLKINNMTTHSWLTRLYDLCPNVKKVEVNQQSNFTLDPFNVPILAKFWPDLESIEISHVGHSEDPEFYMDSILTGFEPEVCGKLREGQLEESNIEQLRVRPSLENFKELKKLKFVVHGGTIVVPISRVSGLYIFRHMPRLKAILQFDHGKVNYEEWQKIHQELGEYVNIQHGKSRC